MGDFRGFPELMYAGVLTWNETNDLFLHLSYGNATGMYTRPMTLGCSGYNNKQTTYTAYGMAYGLLVADMVERFLLHYFAMSAHTCEFFEAHLAVSCANSFVLSELI